MANRAYENAQNRIGPRGAAQHHKAHVQASLSFQARKMYEAIYSETERAQYEKAYQHPCGCTCGCDFLANEGDNIFLSCYFGSHADGSDNTLAGQLNESGHGSGGMF